MTLIQQSTERSYTLSTDKNEIAVYLGASFVNVTVLNAAHRAYRGMGRTFHGANVREGLTLAIAAYKSADVRNSLQALLDYID